MELHLQPYRQAVAQYPFRQLRWIESAVGGRKQHGAAVEELVLGEDAFRPFVIRFIAQHEFDFVFCGEQGDVVPMIFGGLAGGGGFDVQHAHHSRIHAGNIQRAAGFQRHLITGITQRGEQWQAILLCQRLAPCDSDVVWFKGFDLTQDVAKQGTFAAGEGVGGVAISAAQRAAGEADKHRGQSDAAGFTLQRIKNFGDA